MKDSEIIELCFARDEQALYKAKESYGALVRKISSNVLEDSRDSEECENEVWLTLWRSVPPLRPQNLRAWLCRCARNAALNLRAQSSAAKRSARLSELSAELSECLPSNEDTADTAESRELARLLSQFLTDCKKESRIIFVRRYWFCDTVPQIAKLLGKTARSVESSLYRTRRELRDFLKKEGFEP